MTQEKAMQAKLSVEALTDINRKIKDVQEALVGNDEHDKIEIKITYTSSENANECSRHLSCRNAQGRGLLNSMLDTLNAWKDAAEKQLEAL